MRNLWLGNVVVRAAWLVAAVSLAAAPAQVPEAVPEVVGGVLLVTPRSNPDPAQLGVVESYRESVALEREITRMYQEIRAAKLSLIQRQRLDVSMQQTLVPISQRADVDAEILARKAASSEDVTRYQEALARLMRENDAILGNCEQMLASLVPEQQAQQEQHLAEERDALAEMARDADRLPPPENLPEKRPSAESPVSPEMVADMAAQAEEKMDDARQSLDQALAEIQQAIAKVEAKVEEALAEDVTEKGETDETAGQEALVAALDEAKTAVAEAVSAVEAKHEKMAEKVAQARQALAKVAEALAETVEAEAALKMAAEEAPRAHAAEAVANIAQANEDLAAAAQMILTAAKMQDLLDGKLSRDQEIAQQQVLGELARAESGQYLDMTRQMRGEDFHVPPHQVERNALPPPIKDHFRNVGGRKIVSRGGTPAVWFYVGDWYLLGPYDNAGRMNLQKVFPPESLIDLDANYPGKHGEMLKWGYDSFAQPMIWPGAPSEYAIYYGYTELHADEDMEVWVAVGSDDRSDLWINDLPVWHSSNQLKSWDIGEGYRKVHLRKGVNKILFRLENGWHALGFSLLVNTFSP